MAANLFFRLQKLYAALHHPLTAKAFLKHQVLAGFEHQHVLRSESFSAIVDIGANRGQFSLAARALNPQAKIFAFEPLPDAAAKFKKVLAGDANVFLRMLAIADKNGHQTMHISKKNDSSSLLRIGDRQVDLFPDSVEITQRPVQTVRLIEALPADEITHPAILKIDVQGFELEVLKGSLETFHHFKYIYVECSFVELYEGQAVASEVISFLASQTYLLRGVYNVYFSNTGEPIQGDFLFFRN